MKKHYMELVEKGYAYARKACAAYGVDTDTVLKKLEKQQISLHCWQGDDVNGFEVGAGGLGGGILSTGNYPGRARNGDELRADYDMVLRLIPGKHLASTFIPSMQRRRAFQ